MFGHSFTQAEPLEMQGGGPHHDAGSNGEFVLTLAIPQFLGPGSAWAGNEGQLFGRMVQDIVVGLFSCQDFLVCLDGSVDWNHAGHRGAPFRGFVVFVEPPPDEILLVKLSCFDVALSNLRVELVDV